MSAILTLPRLGETMEEGTIVTWLVAPGAAYRRGDALLEIETDKTVVEVPALEDGELVEILAPEGAQVSVGDPLARLSGGKDGPEEPTTVPPPQKRPEPDKVANGAPASQSTPAAPNTGLRATPVARRLAREAGLDLRDIPGTGRRGRIERADIEPRLTKSGKARSHGLAYSLMGQEGGPPVVMLHGFAGDNTLWAAPVAGLARAGRRILAPDLPGHGATSTEAMSPADLSAGLEDLIDETLGAPAHVVAHSLGAVPATALANAGVARSLTLIAPAGLGLSINGAFIHGLAAAESAGEVAHLLQRMMETPLALSSEALDQIAATLRQGRLTALADAIVGTAGQRVSLRADLERLAAIMPVRIIAAHRDRVFDWQDMATVSPDIAVHHLPRAGHMAWWDSRTEVAEVLRRATSG